MGAIFEPGDFGNPIDDKMILIAIATYVGAITIYFIARWYLDRRDLVEDQDRD